MKVLIDIWVWSKGLSADNPDPKLSKLLRDLIIDNRVVLIGTISQEILSAIKNKKGFWYY